MKQYVIGDIHGAYNILRKAMDWVEQQEVGEVIFLGDYIDRGDQNVKVIDYLMSKKPKGWKHTYIRGNHEDMLIDALRDWEGQSSLWLSNGGIETFDQYNQSIPDEVVKFLNKLPRYKYDDHRIFTHAFAYENAPIDEQTPFATQWARPPHSQFDQPIHGRYLVHGHTPLKGQPFVGKWRANLDIGGVWYNKLAIAVFDTELAGPPIHVETVQLGPLYAALD